MRKSFNFVGTIHESLSLDPEEFRGLTAPRITEEIKQQLRSIHPGADFFEQEIAEAAAELAGN